MNKLSEECIDVFTGKVVRKELTKKIKEGANVPIYVRISPVNFAVGRKRRNKAVIVLPE